MNELDRTNGILLSITSLPSKYGIGDLGISAFDFVDTLTRLKAKAWQILPMGPVGFGNSPYASRCTFAGNELLIDLDELIAEGLLSLDVSYKVPSFDMDRVEYDKVKEYKWPLLVQASKNFLENEDHPLREHYDVFLSEAFWLDDYALYQALVDYYNDSRWYSAFDKDIATRKKSAITKWTNKLEKEIRVYKVLQFFFDYQYNKLKVYANKKGIKIIGDIPIFVAIDSSDAWSNIKLFKINAKGEKQADSGVPPDAFSSEGQFWGNPVYKWSEHKKENYSWWKKRIKSELKRCDIIRIDHFRGFESYWEIPSSANSAKDGKWVKGPGQDFFDSLKEEFGENLPFIAEDLGVITDDVNNLREDNNLCGMKILQFAFEYKDGKLDSHHMYLPHNYDEYCIGYTGTHDNDTTRGWYNNLDEGSKDLIRRYLQSSDDDVVWQMIRSLFASRSSMVITPIQDILGLDSNYRMNLPSTCGDANWAYRFNTSHLQDWQVNRYAEFVEFFNRYN